MSNEQENNDVGAKLQRAVADRKSEVVRASAGGTLGEVRQAYLALSQAMFACKQAEAAER